MLPRRKSASPIFRSRLARCTGIHRSPTSSGIRLNRPPVVLERLGISGKAPRLITSLEQVLLGLLPLVRARKVVGEHTVELIQVPREE